MKIFDRIVEALPLPIVVALGLLILVAWILKQLRGWQNYGLLFRDRLFIAAAIIVVLGLPAYYGARYYWQQYRLVTSGTPRTEVGIWVARFEGDTERAVQRSYVEELQILLNRRADKSARFQVRYLDQPVTGATLPDRHESARKIGKKINASLVLWGDVIGNKLILHVTLVQEALPSRELDIAPIVANLRETEVPVSVSRNLHNLASYLAALAYVRSFEMEGSSEVSRQSAEKAVAALNELGQSGEFDLVNEKERELAAQTKAMEGYVLFGSDEFEKASQAFRAAARLDRRLEPIVNTYLGMIAFNLKKPWEEVLQYYEHGANYWLNWYAMGKLFFNIGELKAAEHAFDKSISQYQSNPYPYFYKARIYEQWKDVEKAIEAMTASVKYLEKETKAGEASKGGLLTLNDAKFYLGQLYDKKGDTENAIRSIRASLKLNPANSFANNYLATIYLKSGDIKSGIEALNAAIKADPNNYRAYYNLASARAEQGEYAQATELYEKAASLQKDYVQPLYQLAKLYAKRREYEKAINIYERALKRIEETWNPSAEQTRDISTLLRIELEEVRVQASGVKKR